MTGAEVVVRPLSPTQATTRRKLIDAAVALATEGGYEAVGMRQVAAHAGVSAPTAYQYFSSKDHVLVDALVDLVGQTTADVEAKPPGRGRSAADRVAAALRRAVQRVERSPGLYVAVTRAFISGTPEVAHVRGTLEASMRRWIELALEGSEIENEAGVTEVLEAVLFANMVGLVTGATAPADVGDALERAVRTLLPERGRRR
ncbi:MAG TPA: TetR/AcrR family transcriptional regulator [Acidimicrobiia bacterium]